MIYGEEKVKKLSILPRKQKKKSKDDGENDEVERDIIEIKIHITISQR